MSKYNRTQLRDMARTIVVARNNGDYRYIEFMTSMMMKTGFAYEHIEKEIERLAR